MRSCQGWGGKGKRQRGSGGWAGGGEKLKGSCKKTFWYDKNYLYLDCDTDYIHLSKVTKFSI